MKFRNPVALETIPVSRRLGQYRLQSMAAALLEAIMASTIKMMFSTGCCRKNTRRKQIEEEVKARKAIQPIKISTALLVANTLCQTRKAARIPARGKPKNEEKV